jgi:hypothetical protein
VQLVDERHLAKLRLVELAVPALELAGDVPVLAAEVTETDGIRVDVVDGDEHVDEALARLAAGFGVERLAAVGVADDESVDEAHHVERRAVDLDVVTESEGRRHGDGRRGEGADDPVLASHVVGGGEDVAEGRPAKHEVVVVDVGDAERQVASATGDQLELERSGRALDVLLEPGRDLGYVDAVHIGS